MRFLTSLVAIASTPVSNTRQINVKRSMIEKSQIRNPMSCRVKGLQLKTGCPVEDYFKLSVVETNQVNPCEPVVANLVSKTRPQNHQKLENILGKLGFFFS